MSAEVETMFYVRQAPWHGLGTRVEEALSSKEALEKSGLDWHVIQKQLYTSEGNLIGGYLANERDSDQKILGVVSDRYKVVQNEDAFAFTDELLGQGVRYETAGSLAGGRRIWMLARLPKKYVMNGDEVSPYLVVSNTHDGSGSIKVALTPIRVVCQNTLCLALSTAQRSWSTKHTTNIESRFCEAKETLFRAEEYMDALSNELDYMSRIKIPKSQIIKNLELLFPVPNNATSLQEKNVMEQRNDVLFRYEFAPDLKNLPETGYRFYNAVTDFATHAKPLRETKNYQERLFTKTIDTNVLTDKAYRMVLEAA